MNRILIATTVWFFLCVPQLSWAYYKCFGTGEECPQTNDLQYTDFPGVTDEKGTGFSRNQNNVGLCERYANVDFVCYKLKELGLWKSQSNCSVYDFHLWLYKKKRIDKNEQPLLSEMGIKDPIDSIRLKARERMEAIEFTELLDFSEDVGLCPEERFRSEYPDKKWGDKDYFTRTLLLDIAERLRNARLFPANAPLSEWCPECRTFAPTLTDSQWQSVRKILSNAKNDSEEFAALDKINQYACPDTVRVKLPGGYSIEGNPPKINLKDYLDDSLDRMETFIMSIGARTLDPKLGVSNSLRRDHTVVVAGAMCAQIPGKPKGQEHCYYIIKNSWGYKCRDFADSEHRICDRDSGAVLLTWDALDKGLDGGAGAGYLVRLLGTPELRERKRKARAARKAGANAGPETTKEKISRAADFRKPEMVRIPGGSIEIGSTVTGGNPVRTVSIESFELGKYEVTQSQWKAIMGDNPSSINYGCDDCPVEYVSRKEVQKFIQELNRKTGKQYRLPTEEEWEYACYGGKKTKYCGGDDIDAVAWYSGNSGDKTHPVGQKQANGYGLYDMSGNVWELTEKDLAKGGSLNNDPQHGGILAADSNVPARRNLTVGFRLARTLP